MDLVDEQNRARLLLQLGDHALQALLEVAAILGARDQRTHVECINRAVRKHFGNFPLDDQARQSFGDRGLTDARFTYVQGVVLAAPAQNLDRPLHFQLAADQRIDPPVLRQAIQIRGVFLKSAAAFRVPFGVALRFLLVRLLLGDLRQTVRDVIDDVETRHMLAIQKKHGVALFLAENRDEHIRDADLLLAAGLDVKHRSLQNALEAQRGLHLALLTFLQSRRGLVDVFLELLLELAEIAPAGTQDLPNFRRINDREQQVLDRQIFMTRFTCLMERIVETIFKLVGQHVRRTS